MSSLLRIAAIASNTTREAIRNRAFIGLLLAALAFIAFSLVLGELAVRGQAARVVQDFGPFAIGLFGVVIAITMGVILLYKEIDKKTIFTIIPKPVHRFEIVLGKYVGLLAILLVTVAVLGLAWTGVLAVKGAPVTVEVVKVVALVFFEIMLVTAVAVLFSAFSSPVLSGLFTFGIFFLGRVAYQVDQLLDARRGLFVDHPSLRPLGEAFVAVFPDLQVFDATQNLLLAMPIPGTFVAAALTYSLAYVAFFLALAVLLFQRRDFI